jgi:hypothetical protein
LDYRRKIVSSTIAIILLVSLVGFISFQNLNTPTPYWRVQLGTTLAYSIQVSGFESQGNPLNISDRKPPPYNHLNNSQMTVKITSLPEIPLPLNQTTFADVVIEATKTTLLEPICYLNGTDVINPPHDILNDVVSHCILPIDKWESLDSLYVDEPDFKFACNTYLSKFENDSFFIGYRYFNIDSGNGWHGFVNLQSGIPSTIELWANEYYGNDWFSYHIVLCIIK